MAGAAKGSKLLLKVMSVTTRVGCGVRWGCDVTRVPGLGAAT